MTRTKIHLIAAARPNFMKVAPLHRALREQDWCEVAIVHTGQHYDASMSAAFFRDLDLPEPDVHLGIGSGSHAQQTGGVMIAYEQVAAARRPDWIVVVGDVNSTMACALVGAKLRIPVAHLEAGLRSRDRAMPEEINRIVTDAVADLLWTPSRDADANLLAEGIPAERIEFIGNIMIDNFEFTRRAIESCGLREALGLASGGYGVVTLHRPANVDERGALEALVAALHSVAQDLPLVFAVHPRTRRRLEEFGLLARLEAGGAVRLLEPLGYIEFMSLVVGSRLVITDSGGVQEETTVLGIHCLTLRGSTERPVTITEGTNRLVRPAQLAITVKETLALPGRRPVRPERWDGRAAGRAAASLRRRSGA